VNLAFCVWGGGGAFFVYWSSTWTCYDMWVLCQEMAPKPQATLLTFIIFITMFSWYCFSIRNFYFHTPSFRLRSLLFLTVLRGKWIKQTQYSEVACPSAYFIYRTTFCPVSALQAIGLINFGPFGNTNLYTTAWSLADSSVSIVARLRDGRPGPDYRQGHWKNFPLRHRVQTDFGPTRPLIQSVAWGSFQLSEYD
jgi:hypothetical protein